MNSIVQEIKPYRYFVPYIQQHEIETLLFANPKAGFELAEDKRIMNDVIHLCVQYESIEDINCTPEGAPSKRLEKIYKEYNQRYDKVTDAVDIIVSGGGIEPILDSAVSITARYIEDYHVRRRDRANIGAMSPI